MNEGRYSRKSAVVTINGVNLAAIEIAGERVVTLAMIDEVHQRPSGTAGRNFRENRSRLVAGEDYHELTADEIRRQSLGAAFPPRTAKGIVLTESGYLMLVKSLTDDLAWDVQRKLVKAYFTPRVSVPDGGRIPTPQATTAIAREVRLTNSWLVSLAKASGVTGNQALIAASQGTERMTGINPLVLMGITHLPAPQNENLLCPRDIAHRLGGRATDRSVNLTLTRIGLQTASRDHKGKLQYDPTLEGIAAGGVMMDTGKTHSSGAPVRQLRWAASIVHVVDEAMQQEDAA